MVQYIDTTTAAPCWNQILSAMVNASIATSNASSVQFKVRLIYITTVPTSNSRTYPIASWTAGTDPVLAAGFTAIAPVNDPVYTLTGTNKNFSFDGFQLPASSAATMTLGIMIYTVSNMNQTGTADQILFNRVSLIPNDFAIDASPETFDETIRKCEYYYEKSYNYDIIPGTVTSVGANSSPSKVVLSGGSTVVTATGFYLRYKQLKRMAPLVTYYSALTGTAGNLTILVIAGNSASPTGTSVNVASSFFGANYTGTASTSLGLSGVINFPLNTGAISTLGGGVLEDQGMLVYHYTLDARIGR